MGRIQIVVGLALLALATPVDSKTNPTGEAEARFTVGWHALENGQTDQAVAAFEAAREGSGDHGPTRRVLAMIDALKHPCPTPDLATLLIALRPGKFLKAESAHVVLLHQGAENEANERLNVLERVVTTFALSLSGQGLSLPPPTRKLVSVYYADGSDYSAFLSRAEASAFHETQGYYHPTLHVVFAFDTRSTQGQKTGRRAIANRRRSGVAPAELERQRQELDRDWRAIDLGIAAHETVHQLTDACGLAPRFDDFPLWLHEGFAAQFEVVRDGQWGGVGRVHDIRLPDWRAIRPSPPLIPLLRDSGFGHGYRREVYAQSWSLVYFLRKTKPNEFLTYLDLLRTPAPESTNRTQRQLDAFRSAFGEDLVRLEKSWHVYLAGLEPPENRLAPTGQRP